MLIAIVLTLTSPTDATLPPHLGRANYAATLAALQALDPALGPALHDGEGSKPLTCSGLLTGAGDHEQVAPARRRHLLCTHDRPDTIGE